MEAGFARFQSGAIPRPMIGALGFAAGVLIMGLVTLTHPAAPPATETERESALPVSGQDPAKGPDLVTGPDAWTYNAAAQRAETVLVGP